MSNFYLYGFLVHFDCSWSHLVVDIQLLPWLTEYTHICQFRMQLTTEALGVDWIGLIHNIMCVWIQERFDGLKQQISYTSPRI